ncbi:MAG: Fic family protein [Myxococcota bacterium]
MDWNKLTRKKQTLDKLLSKPNAPVPQLDDWFRVELTYTSNAIEGNTLTRRETALVVEKGLTVGGKSLIEHLEATNHAAALDWVKQRVKRESRAGVTPQDILRIHGMILKGIDDDNAGRYRRVSVRIAGSAVILPNPRKVPVLMEEFYRRLRRERGLHPAQRAAQAHYRLVTIHPFADGNGRTARLLMNMILLQAGYPAAIIRTRDRLAYLAALEKAQLGGSQNDYETLILQATERSLDLYLRAARGREDEQPEPEEEALLKIGKLAQKVGEPNSTIRHWTKEGLLHVADVTASGYQLYAPRMSQRIEQIRALQKRGYTLSRIKQRLGK